MTDLSGNDHDANQGHPAAPPDVLLKAQVDTAREMVNVLKYDIQVVGAWLFAIAAGAFTSVEHAIEHILGKT